MNLQDVRIAVIGLGYVGLPLAVEFGRAYPTIGYDIDRRRITQLMAGVDTNGEVTDLAVPHLTFSDRTEEIAGCNIYVVAVPTPVDRDRKPDLAFLLAASRIVGGVISPGDVVIYESTVYPGATEEDCLPVVEACSNLVFNRDFFAGYSPERINPGDATRPITKIRKITSGSTPGIAAFVDALYASIIPAGTHLASSIRVAEAAKVIENTQRDVNIALVNELSIILSRLGIDTTEVLQAAATKWNFMPVQPGLVGGHCISVDPYYLMRRSERAGHVPDIIRISREINDGMPRHAASQLVRVMIGKNIQINTARVLVMGATFKENCTDFRNTKIADLITALKAWGLRPELTDPAANAQELKAEYGLDLCEPEPSAYAAVILAVPHREFIEMGSAGIRLWLAPRGVFFDLKSAFPREESDLRL